MRVLPAMPTPTTARLAAPKDWDEFEAMIAALLQEEWSTPNVSRNARNGFEQQGVDLFGRPKHLSGGYSGIQCKAVANLSFAVISAEVQKAKEFEPLLKEYIIATTAPTDKDVQKKVREANINKSWPFDVEVWFWPDISLRLVRHRALIEQFYGEFVERRSTREQVLSTLLRAAPEDFNFDGDYTFLYKNDVDLRVVLNKPPHGEVADLAVEPGIETWLQAFPAHGLDRTPAFRRDVEIWYGNSRIDRLDFLRIDGGRYLLPMPYARDDLRVDRLCYHLGLILQPATQMRNFENGFKKAKFSCVDVTDGSIEGLKEVLGSSRGN